MFHLCWISVYSLNSQINEVLRLNGPSQHVRRLSPSVEDRSRVVAARKACWDYCTCFRIQCTRWRCGDYFVTDSLHQLGQWWANYGPRCTYTPMDLLIRRVEYLLHCPNLFLCFLAILCVSVDSTWWRSPNTALSPTLTMNNPNEWKLDKLNKIFLYFLGNGFQFILVHPSICYRPVKFWNPVWPLIPVLAQLKF